MGAKNSKVQYVVISGEYGEGDGVVFENLKDAARYIEELHEELHEDQMQCRLFEARELIYEVEIKAKVTVKGAIPE